MKDKKAYSLLVGLIAFFIFAFITTSVYSNITMNQELKKEKQDKIEELDTTLKELNDIKNDKANIEIQKFSQDFSEAEIFNYINEYIEQVNNLNNAIVLEFGSISFSEPKKSDIGFREISIDLKLKSVRDTSNLKSFMKYLTNPKNKYSFFITNFSFPIEKSGPYKNISIPLKMFIK